MMPRTRDDGHELFLECLVLLNAARFPYGVYDHVHIAQICLRLPVQLDRPIFVIIIIILFVNNRRKP
jgi:hypothetical protein